jgi:hypothetical protein
LLDLRNALCFPPECLKIRVSEGMGTGGLYCQTNEKWHRIAGAACIYVLTK